MKSGKLWPATESKQLSLHLTLPTRFALDCYKGTTLSLITTKIISLLEILCTISHVPFFIYYIYSISLISNRKFNFSHDFHYQMKQMKNSAPCFTNHSLFTVKVHSPCRLDTRTSNRNVNLPPVVEVISPGLCFLGVSAVNWFSMEIYKSWGALRCKKEQYQAIIRWFNFMNKLFSIPMYFSFFPTF